MTKKFILDGTQVTSMDSFYDEVQRILCPGFRGFGRNLHAFRDVLRGGFMVFEENEVVEIELIGSKKMKKHLPEGHYNQIVRIFKEAENVKFSQT